MKSLLKYVSMFGVITTVLVLTACNSQPNFDVTLENGSELAIESDHLQLTNQEMFEIVTSGYVGNINPGVSAILDWADYIILSDLVEIDEDIITSEIEFFQEFFEDESEIEALLMAQGFNSLDAYFANVRLGLMREQAILDDVVISEDDVRAAYDEWFAPANDEDTDLDDDEFSENETPEFEEVREIIEDILRNEFLDNPGFGYGILANLRADAGLTIYSSYFTARYESFLNTRMVEGVSVATGNNNAIASIGDHYLTADELFETAISRFALTSQSQLLDYIDLNVLDNTYNVSHSTIRAEISQAKLNLLDFFYPHMESLGLLTEQQIFDFFLLSHLQGLVIDEHLNVDEDRVQELYNSYAPSRETQHILVDDYDVATDLIARLQAANADEMPDLFADLAVEFSSCPSSEDGGSLGHLSIPTVMAAEFEEATFALAEDEFSLTPVETSFGYHVILVSDFGPTPSLSQFREQEEQRLLMNPRYLATIMFDLREEQNIIFHHEFLQLQYQAMLEQNRDSMED